VLFFSIIIDVLHAVDAGDLIQDRERKKELAHLLYYHNINQAIVEAGLRRNREIVSKLIAIGDANKKSIH
jgi:hypothetical protein